MGWFGGSSGSHEAQSGAVAELEKQIEMMDMVFRE